MADYIQEAEDKLQAARKRLNQGKQVKALKASAPVLYEIIDGEISLLVNKITAEKPLDYDSYLDAHGQVRGIMRIRNLLNSKEAEEVSAAEEVRAIEENLKQFKNDQK